MKYLCLAYEEERALDGLSAAEWEAPRRFFLIEARDLNEAIQVASKWPSARFGIIVVRPIEENLRPEGRYRGVA